MPDEPAPGRETLALDQWIASADAWIKDQGERGDWSRRCILDPALEGLLPDMRGRAVLDLGCGEGRYSRLLMAKGANVFGIDPVPKFIERARLLDPTSTYREASAEKIPFVDGQFDLVLSYLSIVDIPDLEAASHEVSRLLKVGGDLIIVTISNFASTSEGWVKDAQGNKVCRTVDRYMEHFSLDIEWRNISIRNFHRPLSYVLGLFLDQGFVLTKFVEPLPDPTDRHYADECRAPNFQILGLRKVAEQGLHRPG